MLCRTTLVVFIAAATSSAKPLCREAQPSEDDWRDCRVQIGGLAIQGAAAFESSMGPTFQDYLTERFNASHGLEFEAIPLDFNQNFEFVGHGRVDFIYSNPAAYTCMAVEFNLQTVASLINYRKGNPLGKFAGVIFTRRDSPFHTVDDLRNARIEAVSISGLGAMQLQQAELLSQGLDIMKDVPRLTFAFNQNKIVQDVENGFADVGFVRTDLIDRNVASNNTKWEYFRVIGEIPDSTFPFARSTGFTPEWPIGALSHVSHAVKALVAGALLSLDRFSASPTFSAPAIAGNFAGWSTPMNYFGLLDMLQNINYYDQSQKKCLRSSDEYAAINCPRGYVKKAKEKAFCQDCAAGYSCLCEPCAELRQPEFVLKVVLLSTAWPGNIDQEAVNNLTTAQDCDRMSACARVARGQRLQWVLLDQIGAENRLAINAPLVSSVEVRTEFLGTFMAMDVRNVSLDGEATQEYVHTCISSGSGTQVVQVNINGQQASMSPVVLEVEEAPLRQVHCPPGRQLGTSGVCAPCAPGTVSLGGGAPCRPCDPGTFQPLPEQATCEACPSGRAQALAAAVLCEACPPGFSSRGKAGLQACSPCDPGQEAPNNGSERCFMCPNGFYSEVEGAPSCVQCSQGKGTTVQGVADASLCICLPGEYLAAAPEGAGGNSSVKAQRCRPCKTGLQCPGGNDAPLQQGGFWVTTDGDVYSAFKCRNAWECPEGPLGSCASGREGVACNNCQAWHRASTRGMCERCNGADVLPVMMLLLATILIGAYILAYAHTAVTRQRLGQLTVFLTAGQILLLLQLMAAMRNLDLRWTGPALYLIDFLSLLAFDVDILNTGCILSNDGAVLSFVIQLFAYPAYAGLMALVWVWLKRQGVEVTTNDVINMNGLVLLTLYMTLTITSLIPLQCVVNPNGTFTMQTQPGVICFQSEDHWALVFLSVIGILMYPAGILTVTLRATIMYPSYISSGQGLLIVDRYRFLFERFRTDRYYFGVVYLIRNTVLSLIPVAAASFPTVQITLLAAALLGGLLVQIRTWPWRTEVANVTDMLFSSALVLFTVVAGPILSFDDLPDRAAYALFLSWAFCMLLAFALLTLIVVVVIFLWRSCHTEKTYKIFLTHHKAAAGVLARFIKEVMNKHSSDRVFLDSDELQDLDALFDSVSNDVAYLVPLLTPDMMWRPWCIGELVTAFINHVPILPISCDGYKPSAGLHAAAIVNSWSPDDFQPLVATGIDEEMIDAMIVHLHRVTSIELNRKGTLQEQEATILQVVASCEMKRRRFVESATRSQGAGVLIIGHTEDAEAMATSLVLQMHLQTKLQAPVAGPMTRQDLAKALPFADCLIVLLHKGLLYNPTFAGMILDVFGMPQKEAAQDSSGTEFEMVLVRLPSQNSGRSFTSGDRTGSGAWSRMIMVNADPGFVYPGHEFYETLAGQGLGTAEFGPEMGPGLVEAYKAIFKKIAVPCSCSHGSEALIQHQVQEIQKRLSVSMEAGLAGKPNGSRQSVSFSTDVALASPSSHLFPREWPFRPSRLKEVEARAASRQQEPKDTEMVCDRSQSEGDTGLDGSAVISF